MKKLEVILESETGLNIVFKDENGKIYQKDELIKKIDKNYGGIWEGYTTVKSDKIADYIKTTKDNPNKLG